MIDFNQFKEHVVIPTLKYLDAGSGIPYSDEAVDLLMLTAGHESKGGKFLRQVGMEGDKGAFGVYQMELATHNDIWDNFLKYKKGDLPYFIANTVGAESTTADSLIVNLSYATAMARLHYWRVPEALPSKDDTRYLPLLGEYAKKYYNTHLGKATASKYVMDYLDWRDS